ncbi:hypothetical protein B0H16DRAFT_1529133, partial [Mycena metata]
MSSPFASKLDTNYCPTDDELVGIRDLLVEPLTRLKHLEARIADLQKTIDELTEERVAVSTYVDAHRALISPVRRLPLDILQEIFMACLPTDRNCAMSMAEAPVLLGRICSSWRTLSLSTPRLWCSLHIVEPMSGSVDVLGQRINSAIFKKKLAQRLETTAKWLSRSTQLPLSISFVGLPDINRTPAPASARRTRLFLQALIPFAHRWQSIKLWASWDALDSLSHLTDTDVPLLTKLDITQQRGSARGEWPLPALLRASRLSGFAFAGQMELYALPVRWENMTALSLTEHGTITCRRALEILPKCARLQFCRLQVADEGPAAALDPDAPHLELRFLHSLSVGCRGVSTTKLARLLARLIVPALRHLELHSDGRFRWDVAEDTDPNDTTVADLLVFIGTAPAFESLCLHMSILSKKPLVDLVRGLPLSTTKLHFADHIWRRPMFGGGGGFEVGGDLDDDVIVALTPAASGNPVAGCPALRELHITNSPRPSDRVLSRFITARMTGPQASALRRVDIQFARQMQVDITPDIQSFLADGRLEVFITYPPNRAAPNFSPWRGLPEESGSKVAPMFSIF